MNDRFNVLAAAALRSAAVTVSVALGKTRRAAWRASLRLSIFDGSLWNLRLSPSTSLQ